MFPSSSTLSSRILTGITSPGLKCSLTSATQLQNNSFIGNVSSTPQISKRADCCETAITLASALSYFSMSKIGSFDVKYSNRFFRNASALEATIWISSGSSRSIPLTIKSTTAPSILLRICVFLTHSSPLSLFDSSIPISEIGINTDWFL